MKRALSIATVLTMVVAVAWAQAPQNPPAGQPPAAGAATGQTGRGGGGGGGGRGAITPRILSLQVEPASIKPGESIVLSWATEAGTGTIDHGIGAIPPRGSMKVTPKATTTYTLTMGAGAVTRSVTVNVAGTTPITSSSSDAAEKPIARIDGKPDFSGIYGFTGMYALGGGGRGRGGAGAGAAPAQPPSPYANLPTQPTLKPGVENRATPNPAGGTSDCLPLPADTAFGVPYPFQIFQNKKYVIFINEYPGTFRIIPIDEPHTADADPTWMGDSVGRWDGDTLVIDTIAYNGKHSIGGIQQPSESFRTIERLTRTSATGIFYEIIYEDPEKATGQWRSTRTFTADTRPAVNKVMEFICENNRNYLPLFGPDGPPAPQQGGRGARGQE
ncbi:MAG TPA: hypothetical protein VFR18_10470 [Terriglobia bacterium]|nr:hypothetical protein [Terriglobia bacterium]